MGGPARPGYPVVVYPPQQPATNDQRLSIMGPFVAVLRFCRDDPLWPYQIQFVTKPGLLAGAKP
jgi:hypothetical protein